MRSPVAERFELTHVEPVMGTAVSLRVAAGAPGRDLVGALAEAAEWLREAHHRFTTFSAESEWMRYATGRLLLDEAHPDVRHVAHTCASLQVQTEGAFSLVTGPGRPPDPAAYVKGWALQRAAEILSMRGADRVMVNGGGDVVVAGGDEPWRVGIQHPTSPELVIAVVSMLRGAIATSGTYERGAHIVDPASGTSPDHWASVSIVGPDLGVADGYATAAFAMGRGATRWLERLGGPYQGYFVDHEGRTDAVGW